MGSFTAPLGRPRPRAAMALLARRAGLAACLAGCVAAAPATAQDTAGAVAKTAIVQPLTLTNSEALDFGQIAVNGAGTVILTPAATPSCAVTGGLIKYGVCEAAVFEGYGQTGRTVRVKVPGAAGITLAGPAGATMRVTAITVTSSSTLGPPLTGSASSNGFRRYRIVSSDGAFLFRIGGTLNVAAGQALGLYSATFDVDIAYE
jgi:hypothetical protein